MTASRDPKTQSLYERAKQIIPGGTQLLSKRPEMFAPGRWPAYFREAKGCEVWDLDGNRYIDMSLNGVGGCLLGYAHPNVTRAVVDCVERGSMSTLNPPEEVALAETLCAIHPWAEQARFMRTGGEACAVAVRIARAATGRSGVAICGYHGWHDWYLAANLGADDSLDGHLLPGLAPDGVPRELQGTAHTFPYNDLDAFREIVAAHGETLAAVIMEPCRYADPAPGFLETVREEAHRAGAFLIFDEITIGWRRCLGGVHLRLGVEPDMAVFAKALGNGHPVAAVIGRASAMEAAQRTFISSTYWTERVGPTAALAAMDVMQETDVPGHVNDIGARVQTLWRDLGHKHGLPLNVPDAYPCLAHLTFDHQQANALRTLYTQRMLGHGFLAGSAFYPTLAHTPETVEEFGDALNAVFDEIARAIESDTVADSLGGPEAHSGFQRLI